ncbi:hypothetical protein SLS55_001576 [Diplodia seriata]|uniref:Uncharacterized protein n=1 Tax=Diplodia seriata TaxID=420778 RepID=A0ABR3CQN4_9PEZI
MASNQKDFDTITANMQTRTLQNQPTAQEGSMSLGEELLADTDEPPDEQLRTPRPTPRKPAPLGIATNFAKSQCKSRHHKESLLTQALHSESDSQSDDDHHVELKRGMSTASTWSNVSTASTDLTSDGGFTSPGTRTSSPSPPLPATLRGLPIISIKKESDLALTIRHDKNIAERIENKTVKITDGNSVEAGLGRRRCITFACGKESSANAAPTKPQSPPRADEKAAEPTPRRCTIKFACDAKVTTPVKKSRMASPPPPQNRLAVPGKGAPRSHRGSDSTVRNDSPKSVRKSASVIRHSRKYSENSDIGRREATRFHEFASSEEEVEEWTQELTCHKTRLTVTDTLKIENGLRKLGEEVEEEALEDDDEDEELLDEDDEDLDLDEDLDDDEEEEEEEEEEENDNESVISDGSVSDGGFQTDDEQGFAGSDDESDAGSDYQWWAPSRIVAPSSSEPEHIRPSGHRSLSDSTCSIASGSGVFTKASPAKKRKPVNIRPRSPELPDSTDFVCGTLDEDRPLEDAYYSALEQRRAAKHKQTPQDIDPTFPTSDPEMDEEDEDDEVDAAAEDSDQHMLMHGQLDQIDDIEGRGRRRTGSKRSPISSPKRLRSPPPPAKRGQAHRSPPPRRLFGQSPKRLRSPPPAGRVRSPPHARRTSLAVTYRQQKVIQFAGMDQGPPPTFVASLPRPPTLFHQSAYYDDDEEGETTTNDTLKRGPMDIKAGTALKRQRRKEKLYQKHCRKACKKEERRPAPGKGAERMREVGMGLAAYRGKKATPVHVLSY